MYTLKIVKLISQYIFISITAATFISCQNSSEDPKTVELTDKKYFTKKEIDSIYKQQALNELSKYNPISNWDDSVLFTYKLEQLILDRVIYFEGSIADIIKKGNRYFLKIVARHTAPYIAEITVDTVNLRKIEALYKIKPAQRWAFVFKVKEVNQMFPELKAEGDGYGEGENIEVESYLDYDYSETLRQFKGSLIAFYIIKKMNP